MLVPVFPLSLTLLIAVADGVPNRELTSSCRTAAISGFASGENTDQRTKSCLESEKGTREKLAADWSKFPAAERTRCIGSIKWFNPTYTELITCLEMYDQVRSARKNAATKNAATPNSPSPATTEKSSVGFGAE